MHRPSNATTWQLTDFRRKTNLWIVIMGLVFLVLVAVTQPLVTSQIELAPWIRRVASLFAIGAFWVIFIRVISQHQRVVERCAKTDPLTGLMHRSMLRSTLEKAIEEARRFGHPMTLLTMDIDGLKGINGTHGHEMGDEVLRGISGYLTNRLRDVDSVFRTDGDEFVVLLHATDRQAGVNVAEELRATISRMVFIKGQLVTVSIGVSALETGEDMHSLMRRSDRCLYVAKAEGGNQVTSVSAGVPAVRGVDRDDAPRHGLATVAPGSASPDGKAATVMLKSERDRAAAETEVIEGAGELCLAGGEGR